MPSHVSARRVVEWVLRVVSLALLCVFVSRAWTSVVGSTAAESADHASIRTALGQWSVTAPARVHVTLDSVLSPTQRDWLAAIEGAGTSVTWSAPNLVPLAATVTRMADPAGESELSVAAPKGAALLVRGPIGAMDSVMAGVLGARLVIPGEPSAVSISSASTAMRASASDSVVFKRLLVEGSAGWETKFTVAALVERGWTVDALTHVAPGVDVRKGTPVAPDTARYAAVIAIDSTASLIARNASRYLRQGGGVVTLHDASSIGPRSANRVVLEQNANGSVVGSTFGRGRMIRVGYRDMWQMRMTDDDTIPDPVAMHRALLARIIASVAYAPRVALPNDSTADPAPVADMVAKLGEASRSATSGLPSRHKVPSSILFGILLVSLLAELASRRLRGAR